MNAKASQNRLLQDTSSALKAPLLSKLRASCDVCSKSKVKCDKERPTCRRCINSSTICHYSPSLRIAKIAGSSKSSRTSNAIRGRHGKASFKSTHTPYSPDQGTRNELAGQHASNQSCTIQPDVSTFSIETPILDIGNTISTSWLDGATSFHDISDDWLAEWSQIPAAAYENSILTTPPDNFPTIRSDLPDTTTPKTSEAVSPTQSHLSVQQTAVTSNEHEHRHRSSFADDFEGNQTGFANQVASPTPVNGASLSHDCTDLAKSTLNAVCLRSADGSRATLPAIDTALLINENAVKNIFTLLTCTRDHDPYLPFIVTVITSKIIAWYHAVGRVEASNASVSSFAAAEAVVHVPLTLGTYKPCSDYETRMKIQLVLGKLRKVKSLVEKFGERFSYKDKCNSNQEIGVYSALESFLKARLWETEEDLKR